ncbi:hypothetical protein GRH90_04910 [Enterobacteriales bacterium SAP-6]|uniref:Uncharacterized protein n=1 Tax=Acerihabitans arboris TaxID=2691583 RepID=A0A845SLC3_9GAMM|nr:hypothetical protein [Acerihabitans arboris]
MKLVWAMVGSRNAASTLPPAVWFAYNTDRKGVHPQTHLAGWCWVLAYHGSPRPEKDMT